ncbi:MAG: extracellular solute-binding protein [Alphaproteobacteria bacterium]|nr:extracellular solute-binding protein [Alphaproteobacteria bacterium]
MLPWFRRSACALVACLVATVPALGQDLKALEEAAAREGQLTWYVSHYGADTAAEVGQAFSKKYPAVKVNVVRSTAQVAFQRLQQDIKNSVAQCDVFSTTDIGHYTSLRTENRLAKYQAANGAKIAPEYHAAVEKDGHWYPTTGILMVIAYNTKKVAEKDAPKSWRDLADPKWKGQLALGHPGFSGTAGVWALYMQKLYGKAFFATLEKNQPLIGRSMLDTITTLNSGERLVANSLIGPALDSAAKGNPIGVAYPEEGGTMVDSPSAILANAPHPNAARLFMEFLLDVEHARIMVTGPRYESVRPEVKPIGGKPLNEVKFVRVPDQEVVDGMQPLIDLWRDTFGN